MTARRHSEEALRRWIERHRANERIDVRSEAEVRRWSERLGVTPAQVKEAAFLVGPLAGEVEAWLKGERKAPKRAG